MAAVYKLRWEDGSKHVPKTSAQSGETLSISNLETIWPVVRLHMANETPHGDIFLAHLKSMRQILENAVLQRGSGSEAADTKRAQNALYSLAVEYVPKLLSYMSHIKTSKAEMGVLLLDILCYLMALEEGSLFSFLSTFSSVLLYLPCPEWPLACQEVVSRLCHFVLPTCLVNQTTPPIPPMGMSSTLMIVLESCSTRHHLLTLNTLMYLKRDVCTDVLSLVAYGTPTVTQSALKLLFHYWPLPSDFSRGLSFYGEWQTPECENPTCRRGNVQAYSLCLDASCVSQHKSREDEAKLYMLLCHECHSLIHRSVTDSDPHHSTLQIPQPLRDVKPNCEFQKKCLGKECQVNRAEVTCYDSHCTAIQGGQPIRMCRDCHSKQHADVTDTQHIYQVGPPNPWMTIDTTGSFIMLEAISKLLQILPTLHKSAPPSVGRGAATHVVLDVLQKIQSLPYQLKVEGSREGIWLLSHYCTPTKAVTPGQRDWLVHLIALALGWLQAYRDILRQVEEEISGDDTDHTSPNVTEYLQYFSNHDDISRLVDPLLSTWLCEVAKTNSDCVVETLQPDPRPCAQVGKLWEKDCDPILRYQSTLNSLHHLHQFVKSGHIPRITFMKIYNSVMPAWLDLLVQLRTEPGKMAVFYTCYHRLLTQPDPYGMEMIEFVWEKFRTKGTTGAELQKALLWLQDLTRLKIPLPYIHHMFESGLERRKGQEASHVHSKVSVASSFDEEVEERRNSMERDRKLSTGSVSGNESEPALLSESGLEEGDAQAIASFNSSLTRSILMLDIWLSQMELQTVLDYGALKRLLAKMLQMSWGSRHSYTDHHDTINTCLLCKATALWFSLATQLLEKNEMQLEHDVDGTSLGSLTEDRQSRMQTQRISIKNFRRKIRRLTHGETDTSEDFSIVSSSLPGGKFGTFPGKSARRAVSPGEDKKHLQGETVDFERESPPAAEVRSKPHKALHKMDSLPALPEEKGEERKTGEEEEDDIHKVFQFCRDHLKPKLHPEAIHKIVECLTVLIRKAHVLHDMEEKDGWHEAHYLFKDLWRCLSNQSSFVAQSCVALLIDCLKYLSTNRLDVSNGLDKSTCWTVFYNGLKTDKFKTVEKFCLFLQFMQSPETELDWNDGSMMVNTIQVTVAYAFCLAVHLLQDKTSSVVSRAQYCLSNLPISTVKTLRVFVMRLFLDHPSYRTLTIHSLSLLNSALPELNFLSLELLERVVSCLATHPAPFTRDPTTKKDSVASEGSVSTPKVSVSSYIPLSPMVPTRNAEEESELLQMALALLLKYIANSDTESSAADAIKKARQRTIRETSVEPEVRPQILSHLKDLHQDPPSLRANPVFHVFLNHIYPVLDNNPEFSSANALIFVLHRLIYSAAPTGEETFLQCLHQAGMREGKRCGFGLGILPPSLRAPWLYVFYVVLYKYIHKYQSGPDSNTELVYLTRCCMEIALNTIEASPHTCPLLTPTTTIPPLRRRTTGSFPGGAGVTQSSMATFPEARVQPEREGEREKEGGRDSRSLSPLLEDGTLQSQQSSPPAPQPSSHTPVHSTMSNASVDSVNSVFLSPRSIPTLHSGLCSVCGRVTNEFDEDVITLCAIVVVTCCHRLPTRVTGYLVSRVIPALAKIINTESGSYIWQTSSEELPPGSASAVASNLLKSLVTQFADRRLFLFLFNHQYSDVVAEEVFTALSSSLPSPQPQGEGEGEGVEENSGGITVMSPVLYFLQDAVNSPNFSQDVRTLSLVHLALFVEKAPLSVATMFRSMNLLDTFCRKLRTTSLLRDTKAVYGFLRFVIQLLASAPENLPQSTLRSPPVHSFSQSLVSCLEVIFCNIYCPVSGLFQLAGNWYKTFLSSPRDAGRLVQLYIFELRKALKTHQTAEAIHLGTFISLTEVLLLEENGYLSYVDSLTKERVYAPELRERFECGDIFLNAIKEMQWDFIDVMLFLDSNHSRLSSQHIQELPQLKLLLGQLVSLRVQHSRPPIDQLRRLINRDLRPITLPIKGGHQRPTVHVRWNDHLSAIHIFAWLLLGAMCHNSVHQVFNTESTSGRGDRCQLLGSLDTRMEVITEGVVGLTRGAMQGIKGTSDNTSSHCQYLLFTFTAIWTCYMELCEQNCTAYIVKFWENFVSNMVDMLGDYSVTDEKHRKDVLHNVNDKIIIPLKKCELACFTLLLPIWRKLSNQLTAGQFQVFPIIPENVSTVTVETWFKEMVSELVAVERESSPHIATTAL